MEPHLKITKFYFQCVRIFWDCFKCGHFNVEEVDLANCKNGLVLVQCKVCLSERKGRINVKSIIREIPLYPFNDPTHIKKFKVKKKEYAKEWNKEHEQKKKQYIKELKKGRKK